jgi:hypothetical protein
MLIAWTGISGIADFGSLVTLIHREDMPILRCRGSFPEPAVIYAKAHR